MEKVNWKIIISISVLCIFGIISLWTVAPLVPDKEPIKQTFFKQLVFMLISTIVLLALLLPSYRYAKRGCYIFYFIILVLLIYVTITGKDIKGASRWIPIGPFMLQPSEFMKLAIVLALARFMMYQKNISTIKGLIGPFILAVVPMAIVLKQPDLGTAIIFFPVLLAMVYVAGAKVRHIIVILLLCAISIPAIYTFVLKDYQRERFLSFIMPSKVEHDKRYHQDQAIKVIGAGKILGTGLGEGMLTEPYYVPERHTDSIFTVIGEGTGFIGSTILLICFIVLLYQSLLIAYSTREPFGKLIATGMTTFLAIQVIINVGMNIGVAPITGITLPFVSYGGSSLLTNFIAVALILNVGIHYVPTFSGRDFGYEKDRIGGILT